VLRRPVIVLTEAESEDQGHGQTRTGRDQAVVFYLAGEEGSTPQYSEINVEHEEDDFGELSELDDDVPQLRIRNSNRQQRPVSTMSYCEVEITPVTRRDRGNEPPAARPETMTYSRIKMDEQGRPISAVYIIPADVAEMSEQLDMLGTTHSSTHRLTNASDDSLTKDTNDAQNRKMSVESINQDVLSRLIKESSAANAGNATYKNNGKDKVSLKMSTSPKLDMRKPLTSLLKKGNYERAAKSKPFKSLLKPPKEKAKSPKGSKGKKEAVEPYKPIPEPRLFEMEGAQKALRVLGVKQKLENTVQCKESDTPYYLELLAEDGATGKAESEAVGMGVSKGPGKPDNKASEKDKVVVGRNDSASETTGIRSEEQVREDNASGESNVADNHNNNHEEVVVDDEDELIYDLMVVTNEGIQFFPQKGQADSESDGKQLAVLHFTYNYKL
jgi:hypothetical protein